MEDRGGMVVFVVGPYDNGPWKMDCVICKSSKIPSSGHCCVKLIP